MKRNVEDNSKFPPEWGFEIAKVPSGDVYITIRKGEKTIGLWLCRSEVDALVDALQEPVTE
jgi:hypothetical protein